MNKKLSFTIILFVIGIVLAVIISMSAFKEAYRSRTIEKEVEKMKQEAERIQNDNSALQKQIDYYSTPQFVEKVSKDKMNLQKPDENVVIVNQGIAQKSQTANDQSEVAQADQNESNYIKWWNFFFKYN